MASAKKNSLPTINSAHSLLPPISGKSNSNSKQGTLADIFGDGFREIDLGRTSEYLEEFENPNKKKIRSRSLHGLGKNVKIRLHAEIKEIKEEDEKESSRYDSEAENHVNVATEEDNLARRNRDASNFLNSRKNAPQGQLAKTSKRSPQEKKGENPQNEIIYTEPEPEILTARRRSGKSVGVMNNMRDYLKKVAIKTMVNRGRMEPSNQGKELPGAVRPTMLTVLGNHDRTALQQNRSRVKSREGASEWNGLATLSQTSTVNQSGSMQRVRENEKPRYVSEKKAQKFVNGTVMPQPGTTSAHRLLEPVLAEEISPRKIGGRAVRALSFSNVNRAGGLH